MGIQNFTKWLKINGKNYEGSIFKDTINSLSLELNPLIYWAYNIVTASDIYNFKNRYNPNFYAYKIISYMEYEKLENLIFKIIWEMIKNIHNYYNPENIFLIVIDGVPPLAKIQEQRKRRFEGIKPHKVKKNINNKKDNFETIINKIRSKLDRRMITPGTSFMINLHNYLKNRIEDIKEYSTKCILYSPYTVPGEGEHKIFDYFRNGTITQKENKLDIIYGADSDLVGLCALSGFPNLIFAPDIINHIIKFDHIKKNLTISGRKYFEKSKTPEVKHSNHVYIDRFKEFLKEQMDPNNEIGENVISDFNLIIMFTGNDFVPKTPVMRIPEFRISFFINAYNLMNEDKEEIESITYYQDEEYKIRWNVLIDFLNTISFNEPYLLSLFFNRVEEINKYQRKINMDLIEETYLNVMEEENVNKEDVKKLTSSLYFEYKKIWYNNNFRSSKDINLNIFDMCEEYFRGILWTLKYYMKPSGNITWLWYYPYFYGPFFMDLALYLQYTLDNGVNIDEFLSPKKYKNEKRLEIIHQLFSVIPRESYNVIPGEIITRKRKSVKTKTGGRKYIELEPEKIEELKQIRINKLVSGEYIKPRNPMEYFLKYKLNPIHILSEDYGLIVSYDKTSIIDPIDYTEIILLINGLSLKNLKEKYKNNGDIIKKIKDTSKIERNRYKRNKTRPDEFKKIQIYKRRE